MRKLAVFIDSALNRHAYVEHYDVVTASLQRQHVSVSTVATAGRRYRPIRCVDPDNCKHVVRPHPWNTTSSSR